MSCEFPARTAKFVQGTKRFKIYQSYSAFLHQAELGRHDSPNLAGTPLQWLKHEISANVGGMSAKLTCSSLSSKQFFASSLTTSRL